MIHFTTNPDGKHTEGIGAMAQYQIVCYILSKLYNVGFYFTGFKNLTHYQYFNITQEQWCDNINNFFNLPISKPLDLPIINFSQINNDLKIFLSKNDNIIIDFEYPHLMSFIDNYVDVPEVRNLLSELGTNIILDDKLKYFNKKKQNVSIHIRKYTQTDCDLNPRREYFNEKKQQLYLNLIDSLDSSNIDFHIYSQGDIKDFDFIKGDNIYKHIEENPLISLYHMIKADALITANSSLSYIAHLLGNHKKCFVRNNFFHRWKNNTINI